MNWFIFRGVFLRWLLWELAIATVFSLSWSLCDKAKCQLALYVIFAIIAVAFVAAVVAGIGLRMSIGN